jgi:hypothetical protein
VTLKTTSRLFGITSTQETSSTSSSLLSIITAISWLTVVRLAWWHAKLDQDVFDLSKIITCENDEPLPFLGSMTVCMSDGDQRSEMQPVPYKERSQLYPRWTQGPNH